MSAQKWLAENPLAQHHRAAVQQRRARGAEAAGGVVERQGDIDPVVRPGAGRAGEAAHVELGAHVGDLAPPWAGRWCRWCRCRAPCRGPSAPRARPRSGRSSLQLFSAVPRSRRSPCGRAQGPGLAWLRAASATASNAGAVSSSTMAVARRRRYSRQWARAGAGEVVVDQGGDDADLGQAEPDRQIVEPVGHQQRHRLAARAGPAPSAQWA